MRRRTIITIIVAVLIAALIGVLWLKFLGGSDAPPPAGQGNFGSGSDRTGVEPPSNPPSNIPNSVSQTSGGSGPIGSGGGTVFVQTGVATTSPGSAPTGVNWLAGGGITGGSGTSFTPSAINQLNNGQVGGSVNVLGGFSGSSSGGSGSGLAIGAIAGTAVACAAFLAGGIGGIATPASLVTVQVNAPTDNTKNFMDCLARTIARAAIQQITNSVVNWINSGFNGKPSFIQNYQQFFASVADQAAGSFIQNYTNFAPFCTPFAKQIQIALAQSYARRNTSAQSCTLSGLLGTNTAGLSSGRGLSWGNLVSFTTNPSNNPYGAYMTAQNSLAKTILSAATNASRNITPSGFINFQQPYACENTGSAGAPVSSAGLGYSCPAGCKCKVTTPGSIIESSLSKTLSTSIDSLNLAKSFDEIISALISQLMTRALQGGVSNLSGEDGYSSNFLTPDQQAAQDQGSTLLTELQGRVVLAQKYGQTEQGSIQDIQNSQQQLTTLLGCWQAAASSTALSDTKQNIAATNAANVQLSLQNYEVQVQSHNAQITRANAAIALLQDLQTQALSIGSTADVSAIESALEGAEAQGKLIGPEDVTQAQQDRATLQSQLSAQNQQTASQLTQCYAFK